ncbi:hypothetical protein CERSUDRAFT_116138 [Gelatoporia subvermispora B]|uniref:Uncharacterized protein n=1 Tax=Ceriporiopsis subvermispora (strain B) TaxID=914234 RepID=M2QTG4_CERS8|nr:hypothetical protein CERSUDRAFT_116138 [Gelatoporia subvermispora B]
MLRPVCRPIVAQGQFLRSASRDSPALIPLRVYPHSRRLRLSSYISAGSIYAPPVAFCEMRPDVIGLRYSRTSTRPHISLYLFTQEQDVSFSQSLKHQDNDSCCILTQASRTFDAFTLCNALTTFLGLWASYLFRRTSQEEECRSHANRPSKTE